MDLIEHKSPPSKFNHNGDDKSLIKMMTPEIIIVKNENEENDERIQEDDLIV